MNPYDRGVEVRGTRPERARRAHDALTAAMAAGDDRARGRQEPADEPGRRERPVRRRGTEHGGVAPVHVPHAHARPLLDGSGRKPELPVELRAGQCLVR